MSLNVNTALYSLSGVDIDSVAKVKSQILSNNEQANVKAIDYSKFNRATLGVDLYSSRTNVDLQKQIALTQAGLYAQAVNVAKLNSQAALNLYSANTVAKNVELAQSTQSAELSPVQRIEKAENTIQLFNINDKNSHSSNGFNPFEASPENTGDEKSEIG